VLPQETVNWCSSSSGNRRSHSQHWDVVATGSHRTACLMVSVRPIRELVDGEVGW